MTTQHIYAMLLVLIGAVLLDRVRKHWISREVATNTTTSIVWKRKFKEWFYFVTTLNKISEVLYFLVVALASVFLMQYTLGSWRNLFMFVVYLLILYGARALAMVTLFRWELLLKEAASQFNKELKLVFCLTKSFGRERQFYAIANSGKHLIFQVDTRASEITLGTSSDRKHFSYHLDRGKLVIAALIVG